MTDCVHEFGYGPVSLIPLPSNNATTKFLRWSGNCASNERVCIFALNGFSTINAQATFGDRTSTPSGSSCPAAPSLPGLRWAGIPDCASGNIAGHPSITHPAVCDGAGYFCCESGPLNVSAPRCGGAGKIESIPDCKLDPTKMLRQPGGCYEVDGYP